MILIGKIQKPWTETGTTTFSDAYGNETTLPTVAAFSMVFSALSMLKALVSFNIINIHIQNVDSSKKLVDLISIIMNHLVYFVSTATFRIGSITLLYSYLNVYAIIPIALFWLTNLSYGYKNLISVGAPYWLISFSSIFFPVYFIDFTNLRNNQTRKMIKNQQYAFKFQSISCFIIFGLSLVVCWLFIFFDIKGWSYSSTMILDNIGFNIIMMTCLLIGFISALLSLEPDVYEAITKITSFLVVRRSVKRLL